MGIQFPEGFVIPGGESPIENIQTNFREDARGKSKKMHVLYEIFAY